MGNHNIRYIVISDLHLGETNSLFTPCDDDYSLIENFTECLSTLVKKTGQKQPPTLILNGDILGLAFSNYKKSLTVFSNFIKACVASRLFNKIIYIPGNHDHHIWNLAKEERFLKDFTENKSGEIPTLQNSTPPLFEDGFKSTFLNTFFTSVKKATPQVTVLYPNMLIPPTEKSNRFVLLHHGHFAENTYHFITKAMQAFYPELKNPETLNELEAENGAWINFAFSQLGRAGNAGNKFEELMKTLSNEEKLDLEVDTLAENVAAAVDFPYLPIEWMEQKLTQTLLKNISEHVRTERYSGTSECSDETLQNLLHYVSHYCAETLNHYALKNTPGTLIWSHTHKPFEKNTSTKAISDLKIMNTGGWVLPPSVTPLIGGAILFIDEENTVESLRIFNDSEDYGCMKFKISTPDGASKSEFGKFIEACLYDQDTLKPIWSAFSKTLKNEIKLRRTEKND